MPAKDKYHQTVINAVKKADWAIIREQVSLRIPGRNLSVDLEAAQQGQDTAVIILIEVKVFENMPSPMKYLETAIGQYVLYRAVIEWLQLDRVLYMAVPTSAYETIFQEEMGRIAIEKLNLRLIIFNPDKEEIERWI